MIGIPLTGWADLMLQFAANPSRALRACNALTHTDARASKKEPPLVNFVHS